MNVTLSQINPIVGNFSYNKDLIINSYKNSLDSSDLIVFPEMAICGYPPQDLLLDKSFLKMNQKVLQSIAEISSKPIIIGLARKEGNSIYNSAALCANGSIIKFYDKINLPTYDVFDEKRYFTKGKKTGIWEIKVKGKSHLFGIQICEDLWDSDYENKVSNFQKSKGAEFIINISASPFSKNKFKKRLDLVSKKVKEINIPFLYCNLYGGQDELIFDGSSFAFSKNSKCIALSSAFKKDNLKVDVFSKKPIQIHIPCEEEQIFNALVLGLRDYLAKSGHKKAIIGLSGGIDSALVACIAKMAIGSENVTGISLPSKFSSLHSVHDAKALAKNLGIKYLNRKIHSLVESYEESLIDIFEDLPADTTEENIQSRIRGNILMALSNKFGYIVLSTGNKTEMALGYCTLYGDMSGGISVISDLSKNDVYNVSRWINRKFGNYIPENTINKPPSAELSKDQIDPFDYSIVSPMVDMIIERLATPTDLMSEGYDKSLSEEIYYKVKNNEYKRRQAAPGLRVTKKAFGAGRRIPIINHFK